MMVPEKARNFMSHGKVMALATASPEGEPNVVPMQQCWWYGPETMVVGDAYMGVTRANVQQNGRASFTVWDGESREGYKFKGSAEYLTAGPEYDLANGELKKKMPDKDFNGVVVIRVEQVYDIQPGPTAGQLITE